LAQEHGRKDAGLRDSRRTVYFGDMIEILRSNDPVLISFAEALLKEAGITHATFDQNMSIMEGSLGILPRRVLVASDQHETARRILSEAGLGRELS
jgi:hypothetical protein